MKWRAFLAVALAIMLSTPAGASTSIASLVQLTDIGDVSVSPDGRYLLFRTERGDVARNSYDLRWHSYDAATGTLRELASGGDAIYADPGLIAAGDPIWLRDGRSFVFRALVDGAIGVWRGKVDTIGSHPLIIRDADVEQVTASADRAILTYELGPTRAQIGRAETSEYDRGIKVDGSVDLAQNLFRGGSVDGRMASQRFVGYWFIRNGLLWKSPRQTYRFDLASGEERPIGSARIPDPFRPPAATATGSALRNDGSEAKAEWDGTKGRVVARIAGGPAMACSDPQCRTRKVSWLAWRPGTDQLVLAFIDGNRRQSLALWDVPSQHLRNVVSSDGLLSGNRWSYVPCGLSHDASYCVTATAGSPPRVERIDLESGERRTIFDPNAAMRAAYRPSVEQLSWSDGHGDHFHGTLLTSAARRSGRVPLFVNYYKCDGFLRGGEGDAWPIPSLLDAGFAIACINAAPFKEPQDAVQTYRVGLEGVRALVQQLDRRGMIDSSKVAMGGFSFGSEVAVWVATHSNILAALSIASAQYEEGAYWIDTLGAPDRAQMIREAWHLGDPEQTPARWRMVSPAMNAASIRAATMLQLPEQEARRIPELAAKLMASGTPTEFFAFPDEDHVIVQPRHRAAIYARNLDWFRYWLDDYVDPDPAKADQYHRWKLLKARRAGSGPPGAHPKLQ